MLTDLDELILSVRDQASRAYIREAVIAYRAGAYRAAVVSTWVAIIYDIIGKLRILDSQGDASAHQLVEELEGATASRSILSMSKFEERLPEKALKTFEFLNQLEFEDFGRIRLDRNRCAHPAFSGETLLFTPSPESVRAHIVHAITYLLAHPPVQGRAAIQKVLTDISGQYFPITQDEVTSYLRSRYLDHAKATLVESLVALFVKAILRRNVAELAGSESAASLALQAIGTCRPDIYERKMKDVLATLAPGLDDNSIVNLSMLIVKDRRIWVWLDEPTRLRAKTMVRSFDLSSGQNTDMLDALAIEPLRAPLLENFQNLDAEKQLDILSKKPRSELADAALTLLEQSPSFRGAEARAKVVLLRVGQFFTLPQIRRALEAVTSNGQIWDAAGIPSILDKFFDVTESCRTQTKDDWENLIKTLLDKMHYMLPGQFPYAELAKKLEAAGLGPFAWIGRPTDDDDDE